MTDGTLSATPLTPYSPCSTVDTEAIDGLTKESLKLLKRYALKGCDNNMIEVMCCEGGCVAGPGCVALPRKAAVAVGNYVKTAPDLRQKLDEEAK